MEKIQEQKTENKPAIEDRPKYIMLEKTKAIYTMLHPLLEQFPKHEKFTLRQSIEDTILEMIKLLIKQNYQRTNEERRDKILEFLSDIYLIEVLLQQSVSFQYLNIEKYLKALALIREIQSSALSRYKNLGGKDENF
jgi:hypothetical protein